MTIEIKIPDVGSDEVEITEILVKVGDKVEVEQSLIIVEGDKASMEIPSPNAGIVKEIKVSIGDKVESGKLIMIFGVGAADIMSTTSLTRETSSVQVNKLVANSTEKAKKSEFIEKNDAYIHATPLIRCLAREFGINLEKIKGTGRKGRILREDIQAYIQNVVKHTEVEHTLAVVDDSINIPRMAPWPKVDFSKFGEIEEIELGRIQKISGANLSRNYVMIPHVTHFDKIDVTDLELFRKQQNAEAEKYELNVKFTPMVFIIKAVAKALKQMSRFNSSLSEDGKRLILKKYINIGVAVDTPNGLVVPVFKNINKKNVIELSREMSIIFKKTREGKLIPEEMQGGCFTVSSLGNLGTTHFTPIVNAPEVAILGVSKSTMQPVWNGKEFIPRLIMPISLSFDHRVIDGADGARFITIINNILSDIRRLIM